MTKLVVNAFLSTVMHSQPALRLCCPAAQALDAEVLSPVANPPQLAMQTSHYKTEHCSGTHKE